MYLRRLTFSITTLLAALLPIADTQAEEGGSGHYLPGAAASFIDAFPGKPGAIAPLNYFTYYHGTAEAGTSHILGGQLIAEVEAWVYADMLGAFYQLPWEWNGFGYALGAALPYVWMQVRGSASIGLLTRSLRDRDTGLGDMVLFPVIIGRSELKGDLKYDCRLSVYAPTGGYKVGQAANTGKNYWTFEPGAMVSYVSSKLGVEASVYAAFDINTKNPATDYRTGSTFHVDGTLAQHLPLLGGIAGVGATAFFYKQITGDSGSGAVLGSFMDKTDGVGPVVSYIRTIDKVMVVMELKWLPELSVDRRLQGDTIWFKTVVAF